MTVYRNGVRCQTSVINGNKSLSDFYKKIEIIDFESFINPEYQCKWETSSGKLLSMNTVTECINNVREFLTM